MLARRARDPADDAGEEVLDLGRSRRTDRRARQQLDRGGSGSWWLVRRRHTRWRTGQVCQTLRVFLRDHDRGVVLAAFETLCGLAAVLGPRPLHEIRGRGVGRGDPTRHLRTEHYTPAVDLRPWSSTITTMGNLGGPAKPEILCV